MTEEPILTEEDKLKAKIKDDIKWLMILCPALPPVTELEPGAQTLGVFQSLRRGSLDNALTQIEVIKLSLAGWIATKARKTDEKRFQEVLPESFIHISNFLVDRNDDGSNYRKLIEKAVGK